MSQLTRRFFFVRRALMVAMGLGTWWVIGVGAFLVITAPILLVLLALSTVSDQTIEGAVHDVERFVELTERAREQVPGGLPLFDPARGAEATAAICRFQALKEEARRALWASSNRKEWNFGDRFTSSVEHEPTPIARDPIKPSGGMPSSNA
jgi:hypothetical protein